LYPEVGEIWKWYEDSSKTHEHYGPGICIGHRDAWEGVSGPSGYVTFNFAHQGVRSIPNEMVRHFMTKIV
jgi:hypothetical protein